VLTASSGKEALEIIKDQEIAVLVTDNHMPGMEGMELLDRVAEVSQDTVRIMMTSSTDLPTVLAAINRCEVYRFVPKPWEETVMLKAVRDALHRYRLLKGMKGEEDFVLYSLAQTIELKDPLTKGHCDRVANSALRIAEALGLDEVSRRDIRYGSWLHDCGKIGVPENILNAQRVLTDEETKTIRKHPIWGAEVARKANLSPAVQDIILYHHERFDGKGYPSRIAGLDIPFEARIVAIADVYDALATSRPYKYALPPARVLQMLAEQRNAIFDPTLLDLFLSINDSQAPSDYYAIPPDVPTPIIPDNKSLPVLDLEYH
jgi:putative nucleotidyltransferase with HDIG domain